MNPSQPDVAPPGDATIDVALALRVSDGRRAFELDVAFSSAARVVALYGPSGAGKSLTLLAMAGLLTAQAGHVRVEGRTLFDSAQRLDVPPEQRQLGYMFQHYALFPHLTVRENIAFGLTSWRKRLSADGAQRVDELIDAFGLQAMAHSRPASLSGGQQQRVALARALSCRPRLLLLDEPFAALNPMLRGQLRTELAAACARWAVPLVMITHDIEDVLSLAEVAFLFDAGRVVREVNLRRATCRDIARRELHPEWPAAPPSEMERRLRQMLATPEARTRD
jgi:molybdate transport system ATP-binding protein